MAVTHRVLLYNDLEWCMPRQHAAKLPLHAGMCAAANRKPQNMVIGYQHHALLLATHLCAHLLEACVLPMQQSLVLSVECTAMLTSVVRDEWCQRSGKDGAKMQRVRNSSKFACVCLEGQQQQLLNHPQCGSQESRLSGYIQGTYALSGAVSSVLHLCECVEGSGVVPCLCCLHASLFQFSDASFDGICWWSCAAAARKPTQSSARSTCCCCRGR